jgi:hypothetical protein
MKCPYCGSQHISDSTPVCFGMPAGIVVPVVRQCLDCEATLSEEAYTDSQWIEKVQASRLQLKAAGVHV